MPQTLPPNANLEFLQKQAKKLLETCRSGDGELLNRVRSAVPRLRRLPSENLANQVKLTDLQHFLAVDYGFESWPKIRRSLRAPDHHAALLSRVAALVGEYTEDASRVLQRVLVEDSGRAAAVAVALGQETTSALMQHLRDDEIEEMAQAIADKSTVTVEEEDVALEDFEQMLAARKYASRGGLAFAEGALAKAVGDRKARAILRRSRAMRDAVVKRLVQLADTCPDAFARGLSALQDPGRSIVIDELRSEGLADLPESPPESIERSQEDLVDALETFERMAVTFHYVYRGGLGFARGALQKSFGPNRAAELLRSTMSAPESGLFRLAEQDAPSAATVLQKLPTESITIVLQLLEPGTAVAISHHLPDRLRRDVVSSIDDKPALEDAARADRELAALLEDA